ncbi:MAG: SDR family oxidoreductase [Burkholderiales bacterium]|nr:MAG: SDR family oxidoreductase [Burkholderiales bacterium]
MNSAFLADTFGLSGRTALVTGAAGGLGLAIARGLGQAGARVIVNDLDASRCDAAVEQLQQEGIAAERAVFSVTDSDAVHAEVDRLRAAGWGIDILVNNAGNQNRKPLVEMSIDEWKQIQAVHVEGAFNCCHAVLPGMVAGKRGTVVIMSSVAGQATIPGISAYATAKGALAAMTRAIAVEYGPHGITCNALAPGFVKTSFTSALQAREGFQSFIEQAVPAGRWAEPEDIAPLVVAFAGKGGAFINGQVVAIDGGMLARM